LPGWATTSCSSYTQPGHRRGINAGEAPFGEPGLAAVIDVNVAAGRLRATTSYVQATNHSGLHILCVGTPQRPDSAGGGPPRSAAAFDALLHHTRRTTVILGKSSVPMGTAEEPGPPSTRPPAGTLVEVAWSPDFLRESSSLDDTARPTHHPRPTCRRRPSPNGAAVAVGTAAGRRRAADRHQHRQRRADQIRGQHLSATKTSFINMIATIASARRGHHRHHQDARPGPADRAGRAATGHRMARAAVSRETSAPELTRSRARTRAPGTSARRSRRPQPRRRAQVIRLAQTTAVGTARAAHRRVWLRVQAGLR